MRNGTSGTELIAWSTSTNTDKRAFTSSLCSEHLALFFGDHGALSVATEASSHPAGLDALYHQPWSWAGGGLGNTAECQLQTCLAGAGIRRDSLTFASLCIVPECTAHDLASHDFVSVLENASVSTDDSLLGREYTQIVQRIADLNEFLGTGWICGDFVVPWNLWPFGFFFFAAATACFTAVVIGSSSRRIIPQRSKVKATAPEDAIVEDLRPILSILANEEKRQEISLGSESFGDDDSEWQHSQLRSNPNLIDRLTTSNDNFTGSAFRSENIENDDSEWHHSQNQLSSNPYLAHPGNDYFNGFFNGSAFRAFDIFKNFNELSSPKSKETIVLDGLKVGSICWIVAGHLVAITGSVAGFSNPKEVYPPSGYVAHLAGQLLVSSRFGVDTFLIISGFLTFHVLNRKMQQHHSKGVVRRYISALPGLLFARVVRIMPLYIMCLLFYTQIAPHLGGGPFWYEWLALLEPCHDYGWTNLLFVNNFVPFGIPTTQTCFYHSWYLAVDMQLFLFSALLVFWYQENALHGKRATLVFWILSLSATTYLAAVRNWSINTFDGAAVARYDIEAYSKPHVRAQSYLTGVLVAMSLPPNVIKQRSAFTCKHTLLQLASVTGMVLVIFLPSFGAYKSRACQYQEWPTESDCGSNWSHMENWMYASGSRTVWCISIGVLLHLFLGRPDSTSAVSRILSWKCWVPLSRLSFAVYLIHPIVIFVWKLGNTEKEIFRPFNFVMDIVSVCVVSYLASLIATLFIEMPASSIYKALSTEAITQSMNGHRMNGWDSRGFIFTSQYGSLNKT